MGVIVGSFGAASGWAGRQVVYDNGRLTVGGEAFALADLLAADQQGLIVWAYAGLREWAYGLQMPVPQVAPASPSPGASTPSRGPKRGRTIVLGVLLALVLVFAAALIINAVLEAPNGSHPVGSSAPAVVPITTAPAISADQQDAERFIRVYGDDVARIQANVQVVQMLVVVVSKDPSTAKTVELAQLARRTHDNVDGLRTGTDWSSGVTARAGALQNAEVGVYSATNELKNAMGALVAFTGNPNAATLARFKTNYRTARADWNAAVRTVWRLAQQKKPPTV